jgi:hypothetical protein
MTVGRIPVIEGGIQPTIFDAKADLLTATANDTPARLAVGANGLVLTADSTTATGLSYQQTGLNLVYSGTFSGATSHAFDNVFTSAYDNYKVIVNLTAVAGTNVDVGFGLRSSAPANVNYTFSNFQYQWNTTATNTANSASLATFANTDYPELSAFSGDVISPHNNSATMCFLQGHGMQSGGIPYRTTTSMFINNTTSYIGCFVNSSSGNIGGAIKIYGYKD